MARQNRSKSILTRMAGFPAIKTLDNRLLSQLRFKIKI
ncbi:MAG: hypothetical protein ACEY3D_08465 [Rickettsia sp.]